ncbi:MAG: long-chain fatty acid--CoA ligase [Acidimicrobiia bacterium]
MTITSTTLQEFTGPDEVAVDPGTTVPDLLWRAEERFGNRPVLAYRDGDTFVDIPLSDMAEMVRRVAAGLIALGIEKGSRIALFSPSRWEFTVFDYAIWVAGCATVTIYETSSPDQVDWIMKDSGSVALIAADQDLVSTYEAQAAALGTCEHVFSIDDGAIDQLTEIGKDVTDADVRARADSVAPTDLATLVYTSGTTGRPKGCHLTQHNFVWDVAQANKAAGPIIDENASTLMFLPLAHIFARLLQVVSVSSGAKMAFSTGIPNLLEELAMVKPTWLFSVPRVFEKVYNGAVTKATDDGKGKIFETAAQTAIDYATAKESGRVPFTLKAKHGLFDRLVYSKLRTTLGGNAKYAVSGGAPLGARLAYFYDGIGLEIYEGYGLTETTAASTVNRPGSRHIGSVGQPLPGVTVRIADDGEVLIKGDHIFEGYWNNPEATAEAIDSDGWFHSGDIGQLDADGFLSITGRKKELIVTAAGKNVAPAVLEDRMRAHAIISQCMVVGDKQPFIAAVVTIDPEEWPRFAEANGKTGSIADNVDDADLIAAVQVAVDDANKAVSRAESIRTFRILPDDFTVETGELTPTLKVKRKVVGEKYAETIDAIYS